jgi:hypothetical protein
MAVSTIDSSGLTSPLTSGVTTNTVTSAAATALTLQSAGTTAITVDTSQNVSVGSATNTTYGKLSVFNAQNDGNQTIANSGILFANSIGGQFAQAAIWTLGSSGFAGSLLFGTSPSGSSTFTPTERMRIDPNGTLMVRSTGATAPWDATTGAFAWVGQSTYPLAATAPGLTLILNRNTSTGQIQEFKYNGTAVGNIAVTGSTTSYNTSSDYRLKEDIAPMTGALNKVAQLKPVTYKWKVDGSDGEGFIAHELAEVCPQAVEGTKDAVDANGKPVYQGIDTSFLVATLTAAIQELKTIVDAQAAEIAELKAKVNA